MRPGEFRNLRRIFRMRGERRVIESAKWRCDDWWPVLKVRVPSYRYPYIYQEGRVSVKSNSTALINNVEAIVNGVPFRIPGVRERLSLGMCSDGLSRDARDLPSYLVPRPHPLPTAYLTAVRQILLVPWYEHLSFLRSIKDQNRSSSAINLSYFLLVGQLLAKRFC